MVGDSTRVVRDNIMVILLGIEVYLDLQLCLLVLIEACG